MPPPLMTGSRSTTYTADTESLSYHNHTTPTTSVFSHPPRPHSFKCCPTLPTKPSRRALGLTVVKDAEVVGRGQWGGVDSLHQGRGKAADLVICTASSTQGVYSPPTPPRCSHTRCLLSPGASKVTKSRACHLPTCNCNPQDQEEQEQKQAIRNTNFSQDLTRHKQDHKQTSPPNEIPPPPNFYF